MENELPMLFIYVHVILTASGVFIINLFCVATTILQWQESNDVISRDARFLQLTGLKPATKYQLRMWSGNLAGISNVSNTSFTTLSNSKPSIPTHQNH